MIMLGWKKKERQKQVNKGKICKYPNCEYTAKSKGYCLNHYSLLNHRRRRKKLISKKNI